MKWIRQSTVLLSLLVLTCGGVLGYEDETEPSPPDLRVGLHWVGGLTHGHATFLEQPLGVIHRSAEDPIFGEESERVYPWGLADELIELVKAHVAPRFWEDQQGADVAAGSESLLIVKATPAIHAAISKYLTSLERDAAPVRVDLLAIQATPTTLASLAARDPTEWTSAVLAKMPGTRVSASLLTTDGWNATVARGVHQALAVGSLATVKSGASIHTPVIEVGRYGLLARVRPQLAPGGEARMRLDVSIGSRAAIRQPAPETLDMGADQMASWNADVNLPLEHWRFVGSAAGDVESHAAWGLFARVRSAGKDYQSPAKARLLPGTRTAPDEAMQMRRLPLQDLLRPVRDRAASIRFLRATCEDAPSPTDPGPFKMLWSPEWIVELIQHTAGSEADWEQSTIQCMNGQLLVRSQPRVLDAIDDILGVLRQQSRPSIAIDVQICELGPGLSDGADTARAPSVAGVRVSAKAGQRNHGGATTQHRYLGGYEPVVRDGAATATPLRFEVDLGLIVEINPTLNLAGDGVHLDLRVSEQALRGQTSGQFEVGRVTLPSLRVHRGQTSVRLRFGETATVFQTDNGEQTRLIRVTARRAE